MPAYNVVDARRSFAAAAQQPASPATNATKKQDWPDSVRQYVRKSFDPEAAIPGISAAEMQEELKKIITHATEAGRLYDINWETYPLPQQIIKQTRELVAAQASAFPSVPLQSPFMHSDAAMAGTKRKSPDEFASDDLAVTPPWRKKDKKNAFEDRVTYSSKSQATKMEKRQRKMQEGLDKGTSKYQNDLEKRRQRFGNNEASTHHSQNQETFSIGPVVGTCETLEKQYFRLTAPPKPHEVRPQRVLENTLVLLKQKWTKERKYNYICDQFKSMRQDLTVQRIKNSFTVDVYECHARIALDQGDLGEYNQCQTQLRSLYTLGLGGHPAEFLAYRILYLIYTCNRTAMNDLLATLRPEDKKQEAVRHALDTRSALALGNYRRFFQLYHTPPPNMGGSLMDMFIERERLVALSTICKA